MARHQPGVRRLREATHLENHISLGLATKHGFRQLFESTWSITVESRWHETVAWTADKLQDRGMSVDQASLSAQHPAGLLSHGSIDDLLAIRARHSGNRDFEFLTQNWISYEFTRDNLVALTAPPRAHDLVVGRDALTGELVSFSVTRPGRDFSSATMYYSIYASSLDQCLLHLHFAMNRQAENVRPAGEIDSSGNERYCRPMGFLPQFFVEAFPDWRFDLCYVLLDKALE